MLLTYWIGLNDVIAIIYFPSISAAENWDDKQSFYFATFFLAPRSISSEIKRIVSTPFPGKCVYSGNLLRQLGHSCIYSHRCSLFYGFFKHRGFWNAWLCHFWYGSAWPRTSRPCLGSKPRYSSGGRCERPAGRDLSLWRLSRCARAHSPGTLHGREPWRVGVIPHKRATSSCIEIGRRRDPCYRLPHAWSMKNI